MLEVCRRVARFPTIQWTLVIVGGNIQDYVPGGVQSQNFASDSLEVNPEGVPVRGKERDVEDFFMEELQHLLNQKSSPSIENSSPSPSFPHTGTPSGFTSRELLAKSCD